MKLAALWTRLKAILRDGFAGSQDTPAPSAHAYARRHCARCGRLLAHSRGGEWSWAHACADGYGVVHISGRFEPRERRPTPVLPMETIAICPVCRMPGCTSCPPVSCEGETVSVVRGRA